MNISYLYYPAESQNLLLDFEKKLKEKNISGYEINNLENGEKISGENQVHIVGIEHISTEEKGKVKNIYKKISCKTEAIKNEIDKIAEALEAQNLMEKTTLQLKDIYIKYCDEFKSLDISEEALKATLQKKIEKIFNVILDREIEDKDFFNFVQGSIVVVSKISLFAPSFERSKEYKIKFLEKMLTHQFWYSTSIEEKIFNDAIRIIDYNFYPLKIFPEKKEIIFKLQKIDALNLEKNRKAITFAKEKLNAFIVFELIPTNIIFYNLCTLNRHEFDKIVFDGHVFSKKELALTAGFLEPWNNSGTFSYCIKEYIEKHKKEKFWLFTLLLPLQDSVELQVTAVENFDFNSGHIPILEEILKQLNLNKEKIIENFSLQLRLKEPLEKLQEKFIKQSVSHNISELNTILELLVNIDGEMKRRKKERVFFEQIKKIFNSNIELFLDYNGSFVNYVDYVDYEKIDLISNFLKWENSKKGFLKKFVNDIYSTSTNLGRKFLLKEELFSIYIKFIYKIFLEEESQPIVAFLKKFYDEKEHLLNDWKELPKGAIQQETINGLLTLAKQEKDANFLEKMAFDEEILCFILRQLSNENKLNKNYEFFFSVKNIEKNIIPSLLQICKNKEHVDSIKAVLDRSATSFIIQQLSGNDSANQSSNFMEDFIIKIIKYTKNFEDICLLISTFLKEDWMTNWENILQCPAWGISSAAYAIQFFENRDSTNEEKEKLLKYLLNNDHLINSLLDEKSEEQNLDFLLKIFTIAAEIENKDIFFKQNENTEKLLKSLLEDNSIIIYDSLRNSIENFKKIIYFIVDQAMIHHHQAEKCTVYSENKKRYFDQIYSIMRNIPHEYRRFMMDNEGAEISPHIIFLEEKHKDFLLQFFAFDVDFDLDRFKITPFIEEKLISNNNFIEELQEVAYSKGGALYRCGQEKTKMDQIYDAYIQELRRMKKNRKNRINNLKIRVSNQDE